MMRSPLHSWRHHRRAINPLLQTLLTETAAYNMAKVSVQNGQASVIDGSLPDGVYDVEPDIAPVAPPVDLSTPPLTDAENAAAPVSDTQPQYITPTTPAEELAPAPVFVDQTNPAVPDLTDEEQPAPNITDTAPDDNPENAPAPVFDPASVPPVPSPTGKVLTAEDFITPPPATGPTDAPFIPAAPLDSATLDPTEPTEAESETVTVDGLTDADVDRIAKRLSALLLPPAAPDATA